MPAHDLTHLANQFGSDKGDTALCAHAYTRVYEALLGAARLQPLRLLEIGLVHGHTQDTLGERLHEVGCPSLRMWAGYLPQASLFGFDIVDFRTLSEPRMTIFQGDQASVADLTALVEQAGGPFDVIIDDGSHASHHQQITLAALFPHLAPGGLYCIEDLHYQPADLELNDITPTRDFLRDLRFGGSGAHLAMDQQGLATLLGQIASIHFFDSRSPRWSLAQREDALAVIAKRGVHPLLGEPLNRAERGNTQAERTQPERAGPYAHLPAAFAGHAILHGQRIYCGASATTPDPRHWGIQSPVSAPQSPLSGKAQPYRLGDPMDFRLGGNALAYQRQGWDFSSPGGTWTLATVARLMLCPTTTPTATGMWTLEITAQGLVGPTHPHTHTQIVANGHSLGEHAFGHERVLRLPLPPGIQTQPDGSLLLEFQVRDPVSPQAQGLSEDRRELGLLLVRLCITPDTP
jgi:hypothetical protein